VLAAGHGDQGDHAHVGFAQPIKGERLVSAVSVKPAP
jgi:hypothetical protein